MTSIAMLRGANVGGRNPIKMDALKSSLRALKLKNPQTYIQSGNIVFQADHSTPRALEKITKANPFLKTRSVDLLKLHVTFLSDRPAKIALEKLESLPDKPDQFQVLGREIYILLSRRLRQYKAHQHRFRKTAVAPGDHTQLEDRQHSS
jgi:uncharacterized protein (DUF1697 family)